MDCMREQFGEDLVLDGRFRALSPLNHGSFGMVFMAKDLRTGSLVAVKCLTKSTAAPEYTTCPAAMAVDEHSEELSIHSGIGSHPNIVNLISNFETDNHVYLVLEFCPSGDLYEAIRSNRGPLETEHVRDFMLQLVNAVDFMHKRGIFHRDIKPENIFLTHEGSMKLGDFGLATRDTWSTEQAVGSDRYMAPEQYDAAGGYGYSPASADIWAIGICLLNVLFSRNPFATPTHEDPLFADYVRDRQSLFDIFPNMSQDTFHVLMQCLTLDPSKRSLSAVRDALYTVVTFTTDDEILDDFCAGNDVVPATLNREPLRTPSITASFADNVGSFPWAKALQATPQKQRQLSVIPDTEEMFPASNTDWYGVDAEAASLASALDSGIGMSYKSSNVTSDPIRVPVSSSLPANTSSALYGNYDEMFSKSWSDLWEEDEEEQHRSSFEDGLDIERVSTAKPAEYIIARSGTPALDIKAPSRRSSTPRVGLSELKNANSRSNSPEAARRPRASNAKLVTASAPNKYSAPAKRIGFSIMDKWAMLGSMRRSDKPDSPATPHKPDSPTERPGLGSSSISGKKAKSRDRSGSWRKSGSAAQFYANDQWNLSKDWRSPQQPYHAHASGKASIETPSRSRPRIMTCGQQLLGGRIDDVDADDIGDLEWVGGWQDLHL